MEFKIISILVLTVLNWIDFYLTKIILRAGGKELNPIIKKLGMLPVKIIVNVGLIPICLFIHWKFLIPPIIGLLFGCIWNWIEWKKIKKRIGRRSL